VITTIARKTTKPEKKNPNLATLGTYTHVDSSRISEYTACNMKRPSFSSEHRTCLQPGLVINGEHIEIPIFTEDRHAYNVMLTQCSFRDDKKKLYFIFIDNMDIL
jgi:hypothetical protein